MTKENTEHMEFFDLPIYYTSGKCSLKENIIEDLELVKTKEESCSSIYSFVFETENIFVDQIIPKISKYYTTDHTFLRDSQNLLKKYNRNDDLLCHSIMYKDMYTLWNEIKTDNNFTDKYYYIGWEPYKFLNNSEHFLQIMSVYNIFSPLIALFTPIIILIIPFIILNFKGISINISEYIKILKCISQNHCIGKIFVDFNSIELKDKIYILVSVLLYIFSMYQNINKCITFNNNMIKIHNYFEHIKKYLKHSIDEMRNYLVFSNELTSYFDFNKVLTSKMGKLEEIYNKLFNISNYQINVNKIFEIGSILKTFYELYENKEYNNAISYSFGFNGYISCLHDIKVKLNDRKLGFANFIKSKNKNTFKNSYYGPLVNIPHIKNTISLKHNIIISGPNASGKTTILKTLLINIILSQQFGCGFYSKAVLSPYKFIHSYLNIPDTSGRDSLFQAESRRCKEIIDSIKTNKKDTHICIFDELFSGTNVREAEVSSISCMEYITKYKNVTCLLTTHLENVCKKLDEHHLITNYHMESKKIENERNRQIQHLYKLKKGISYIEGGVQVLSDLKFPQEIINGITN
jgi:hypothetical protein